jgi:tetratricopeptide (TPR) repeat protein
MPPKRRPTTPTPSPNTPNGVVFEPWKLIVLAMFFLGLGMLLGFFMSEYTRQNRVASMQSAPQQGALPVDQEIRSLLQHIGEAETQLLTDPNNPEVRVHIGNLYYDLALARDRTTDRDGTQGAWRRATGHYEAARELGVSDADMLTDLGTAYYRMNQPERAIATYDAALALNPRNANTWMNLGVVKRQALNDIPGAISAWQEYLRLDPTSANADRVRTWLAQISGSVPE